MTKRVGLGTIEHGLREAFTHIGIDGAADAIEQATGNRKSASLLRKYADPDSPRHHVPMRDAMAIDLACIRNGHKPPMLGVYQNYADGMPEEGSNCPPGQGICSLALATGAAAGMVLEAVLQSEACEGCNCPKGHYREEIYAALLELEAASAALRKAVTTLEKRGRLKPAIK